MIRNLLAIAVPVLCLILFSGTVTTADEPARRRSPEESEIERQLEEVRERQRERFENFRRNRNSGPPRDEFAPSPRVPVYTPTPEGSSTEPPSPYLTGNSSKLILQSQIRHLRMAAENLTAAGFKEEADKLKNRAREYEQQLIESVDQERLFQELRELRKSVDELKKEVTELRHLLAARRGGLQPIPPPYTPRPTSGHIETEGEKPSVRPTMNHPKPSVSEREATPRSSLPAIIIPSAKLDEPVKNSVDSLLVSPGESDVAPEKEGDFELVPVPDSKKSESKSPKAKPSKEAIPTIPQPYLEKDSNK